MPLTEAALKQMRQALGLVDRQHVTFAEANRALEETFRSLTEASRQSKCNHCLVLQETEKSARYRTLMVVIYAEEDGITPLEVAQQALLRPGQLNPILSDLELGGIIRLRQSRWYAIGCTCDLPF